MNKELEDLHGFPPEIPKEISDKVESMMDKLDNIDIHEDLAKNFEDMRNTGNLITLTPPIDRVQYGINIEAIKEGEWYINPSNEIKQSKFDFNPTTEKKINFSTNPKDTRFPYLVMPTLQKVSDCCNSKTITNTRNHTEKWFVCLKCNKECNLVMPSKEQEVERLADINAKVECQLKYQTGTIPDALEWYANNKQSLQPTAKAVRVEMEDNGEEDWIGDNYTGEPFWNEKWEIKVRQSTEYTQGVIKATEVIY